MLIESIYWKDELQSSQLGYRLAPTKLSTHKSISPQYIKLYDIATLQVEAVNLCKSLDN